MARSEKQIKDDFEDYTVRSLSTIQKLETMLFNGALHGIINSGIANEMMMHSQDLTESFQKINSISLEMRDRQNTDEDEPEVGL